MAILPMFHDKYQSYQYEKHSREICYQFMQCANEPPCPRCNGAMIMWRKWRPVFHRPSIHGTVHSNTTGHWRYHINTRHSAHRCNYWRYHIIVSRFCFEINLGAGTVGYLFATRSQRKGLFTQIGLLNGKGWNLFHMRAHGKLNRDLGYREGDVCSAQI